MNKIDKKKVILNCLLNQPDYISGKFISELTHIPERNVKYLITQINNFYDDLIETDKKGYRIPETQRDHADAILRMQDDEPDYSFNEKKVFILTSILRKNVPLPIAKVLNQFYITRNSLKNEIVLINKELKEYNLTLQTKNDAIILGGSIIGKRQLMLDILENELKMNTFDLMTIQNYIEGIQLIELQEIIIAALKKENYTIDKYSLINYVIHLAVRLFFSQSENYKPEFHQTEIEMSQAVLHIDQIVNTIYNDVKAHYATAYFSKEDIYNISVLMFSRATPDSIEVMNLDEIKKIIGDEAYTILNEILVSVYATYSVNLYDDNFIFRFGLHLKNLLLRSRQHLKIANASLNGIKETFPLVFAIAVHIASIINKCLDQRLSEEEISFIALYVGIISEEKKIGSRTLRCALIIPDHYAIQTAMIRRLEHHFKNSITVESMGPDLSTAFIKENSVDLMITTFQTEIVTSVPIVYVNQILTNQDINHIQYYIDNTNKLKAQNIIRTQILRFFNEHIFFTRQNFTKRDQVIDFICDSMFSQGLAEAEFKSQIYEHEEVCSSSYGGVAIAHPLSGVSAKSSIAVLIQHQAIEWGYGKVNMVFIFTLKESDKDLFSNVFNLITDLIQDKQSLNLLLNVSSFSEFVELILNSSSKNSAI
ncbi:BglG family transcription antiterminator [Holdemania filiformis]|uniref:BglG family transcription antiterminator n=1 Tax=Holdemania filiformis TaxID=61171 RepID=UPI002675126E|nr:PTS sugar transporter subunit IIA [Holdemania filiformis]